MPIRVLDLFSGGGGSSWGAQTAGAEIVCGVDAWDRAVEAYGQNFGRHKARHLTMTPDTGPEALGNIGTIDLILASPECTHHTCARGGRPRDEESKRTAYYVTRFARDLNPRPRWLIIENVVHMRGWDGYDLLFEELHGLGYRTRELVLDASDFGVPQARRRVFILCDLEQEPLAVVSRARRFRSAASILAKPGKYMSRPLFSDRRAPATLERAKRAMDALPPREPFLIVYYGSDGSGGWQPLNRPLRTITTLDRFGLVTWEGRTAMLRMLQVDELSRAMGFDHTYSLDGVGQRRDRIKLLGNGVCPPVMRAIVESLTGVSQVAGFDPRQDNLALAAE
ncbi:DNA cytosine methyltransferase [Roseomonas populi]|uniref:DNA (cytosine-5-)-methyltransferase n=1 Tax=Roseomonas populi TaxID=3121582 RepID=A0ABT1X4W3_9PROT|nr:DNA cytosine methyltransferase [Roseomonas pecuniae]MCR0983144.1 DNA cytosine methyltransferase [Roseomonas pecuniae]